MEWLKKAKQLIKDRTLLTLAIPTAISTLSFLGNVLVALSDGQIDSAEFHSLMSGANGAQAIILIIIMAANKL